MRANPLAIAIAFVVGALHCASPTSGSVADPGGAVTDTSGADPTVVDETKPAVTAPDASVDAAVARACHAADPRATTVRVWALPDAGEAPFVDFLNAAQRTIRVFGYQMGFGGVLDTLKARAQAGVDVRVILDGVTQKDVNDKYRIQLEAAGAKFEWSDPAFSYMHAKTIVVDDREALVSTANYSRSFMLKERNFLAHVVEPQDVSDLARLFDADWNRTTPDLSCTRLVVSPQNSEDRIVELVASAKRTLLIESMQFADRGVREAVLARKAAGVDVRVLLAAPGWIKPNGAAGAELARSDIPSRWLASPGLHVKAIVVDDERAYLGSENLSYTSLTKNREIGVVVSDRDALALMRATFENDWLAATPFAANMPEPSPRVLARTPDE